jgi:simple sugar transport system ATP-binding protein
MGEASSPVAFSLKSITRRFGSVLALDNVSLSVPQGSIHAVVGENGAGKTTLMRVLYGALLPDEGTIEVGGDTVRFPNSASAIARGIGMVSQHYAIIPELTNLQNLMLGSEGGEMIHAKAAAARADQLADRMGFQFDWAARSGSLSPAATQKLEILKLLWRDSRILILDEPTAMLSPADGEALFESLNLLVSEGATVVLVTHRIPEVMDHCSRVTVLRGGKWITERAVSDVNPTELAELIIGTSLSSLENSIESPNPGYTVLGVADLVVAGDLGQDAVKQVSFNVRAGEVVGIAGVDGSGQKELFDCVLGVRPARSGTLRWHDETITNSTTRDRIARGIRSIPEDRFGQGIAQAWSLEENSSLGLQSTPSLQSGGTIEDQARQDWSKRIAARFSTKHSSLSQPIRDLSGGNQQRFVVARATEADPRLLLAFQPTRGLDLAASAHIFTAIREKAREGVATLLVSYDLDDLLSHCDRILVMNRGRLVEAPSKDRQVIGRLMVDA